MRKAGPCDHSELLAVKPNGSKVSMVESTTDLGSRHSDSRGRKHDAAECPVEDVRIQGSREANLHLGATTTRSPASGDLKKGQIRSTD